MKYVFIKLLLFITLINSHSIIAQTNEHFSGYGKFNSITLINGNTYAFTITGFIGNGRPYGNSSFASGDILVGDKIFSNCDQYTITSITATVPLIRGTLIKINNLTLAPNNNSTVGVIREYTSNIGIISYALPSFGDGNSGTISGIDISLAACIKSHYASIDSSNILKSISIYKYTGEIGVFPSVTANIANATVAQNNGGELYVWTPLSNLTTGNWNKVNSISDISILTQRISLQQSDIFTLQDSTTKTSYKTTLRDIISTVSNNSNIFYKAGLPNIIPASSDPKIWNDTTTSMLYSFKAVWYGKGTVTSTVAPTAVVTTDVVNHVVVNFTLCLWYNPNTKETSFYSLKNGGGWVSLEQLATEHAVGLMDTLDQSFKGKKTFQDSATFNKGLSANGITTNGIKTTGTTLVAASIVNGVQSESITETSNNISLDGTYNVINVTLLNSNVILTLPSPTPLIKGWKYKIKKNNISSYNVTIIESSTSFTFNIVSDGMTQIFVCNGFTWSTSF